MIIICLGRDKCCVWGMHVTFPLRKFQLCANAVTPGKLRVGLKISDQSRPGSHFTSQNTQALSCSRNLIGICAPAAPPIMLRIGTHSLNPIPNPNPILNPNPTQEHTDTRATTKRPSKIPIRTFATSNPHFIRGRKASGILRTCGPTNGYFADRKMRTVFADRWVKCGPADP